jgi:uncharacterized protein (TIGR00369 family)
MDLTTHFRRLEVMYAAAPCNQHLPGLDLHVSDGTAEVGFDAAVEHQHAAGGMHGSYYFKLMDDAAFFACNSQVTDVFVLTVSFHIELHRPVGVGRVKAVGRVTKPGRSVLFAEAVLFGPNGEALGRGSGTFARSPIALESVESYR